MIREIENDADLKLEFIRARSEFSFLQRWAVRMRQVCKIGPYVKVFTNFDPQCFIPLQWYAQFTMLESLSSNHPGVFFIIFFFLEITGIVTAKIILDFPDDIFRINST
jgi:hypothetical protein